MHNPEALAANFPFKFQPTEEINRGREFRVLRMNQWVLKIGIHPKANSYEQLVQDKKDYDTFSQYIGMFLPPTLHLRANDEHGYVSNMIVQPEIRGSCIAQLADKEIKRPIIRDQFIKFLKGCQLMWQELGRLPDLYADSPNYFQSLNPRFSRNLMVEEGSCRLWLVDTSAHPKIFSKRESNIKNRMQLNLINLNIAFLLRKLTK